ncbi:hypothetical protein F4803DRAFT_38027 [Xylaria telfairii]|nr:hypothetical protein F4803DRAFT_38027 [Xylaria telfairii]
MRNGSVAYEGTGFLVDDLTLVTAASNVLRIDGPVTSINVYAGYWGSCHVRGEERIGQVQCAERIGKRVAVHWGYYDNRYAVQFDLAVIRVNEPFTLVHNYIEYSTCPNDNESEDSCIRVVGYPEHLPEDAKGKYMYESQGHSEPDIVDDGYLLKYSLYGGGSSGSPVLKFGSNGKFHAIGVHRDGDPRCSEAAPLGHNGNLIPAFVRGIEIMESADRQNDPCYRIEEIFSKTPEGLTKISILRPPDEQ